jgi:hypothetical protein
LSENLVIIAWFIQNQAQRGPGSATLIIDDPNGGDFLLIFNSFFDHFGGFLRDVEHEYLHREFYWPAIPDKRIE